MDLVDRVYRVYGLLRSSRYPVPLNRIRRELEQCSRSTAVRTIERMRDSLGAPIDYDRARNGYHLRRTEDGPWELPGLWFNASELHALLAAQELLAGVQPGLLEEELAPLRGRIEQILKSRQAGGRDAARRVRLLQIANRRIEPRSFREVADAVFARRRMRLTYHGRERDATTEREISPQRLVYYRDNWYCQAWDHAKRALRLFALDRIRTAAKLPKAAKEVPTTRLDAHLASGYGIFAGRARRTAVLRFTPERARWVADEQWHPRQRVRHSKDGSYELRVPYADERELLLDILKHGAEVEVIAPASLRRSVERQLGSALEQYLPKKRKPPRRVSAQVSTRTSARTGAPTAPPPTVPLSLTPSVRRGFGS